MLSQAAADVSSECDYERVCTQLHQALHGDGITLQGERLWLAGQHLSIRRGGGRNDGSAQRHRRTID
ncbi:hypothetical protein [Ralstonia sp. SET104]|jgi:hypothetical protein|uniref:hypothetical protein n=1 Tax=Ralstonia sp. SET104 TaxID=2448774 RepID=UPI000FFAFFA2|nr:hypothetical protein [Ralstonia sp. SET104]GCB02930.1 hypothetical protein PSUB009319_05610 [Ralstonia sp. SET104]